MTIEKARELLSVQVEFGGGYNRNAAKLILAEVAKVHGQTTVDRLIHEFRMDEVFGFKAGTGFLGH